MVFVHRVDAGFLRRADHDAARAPTGKKSWIFVVGLFLALLFIVLLPQYAILKTYQDHRMIAFDDTASSGKSINNYDASIKNAPPRIRHSGTATTNTYTKLKNSTQEMVIRQQDEGNSSSLTTKSTTQKPQEAKIENILLMGQFNFDESLESILSWKSIWSRYFLPTNIVVAGPLPNDTCSILLQDHSTRCLQGRNDAGLVSPYENLANLLEEELTTDATLSTIDAVLYLHDDALLNITHFMTATGNNDDDSQSSSVFFPTDRFAGTFVPPPTTQGTDVRAYKVQVTYYKSETAATAQTNFRYFNHAGNKSFSSRKALQKTLKSWQGWDAECMLPMEKVMTNHPEYAKQYGTETTVDTVSNKNGNSSTFAFSSSASSWMLDFAGYGQSDILLVPITMGKEFIALARLYASYNIHLECAIPNLVHGVLRRRQSLQLSTKTSDDDTNTSISSTSSLLPPSSSSLILGLSLCTSWDFKKYRGKKGMIRNCWQQQQQQRNQQKEHDDTHRVGFHMIHPFKIGVRGADVYKEWLDKIQRPLV